MSVYLLKHSDPSKTGVFGGVDFCNGKGTTSSLSDANALTKSQGCSIYLLENGQEKPVRVVGERLRVKMPVTGQELEQGPVVFKAEVVETNEQTAGVGQPAPVVSISDPEPPAEVKPKAAPAKRPRKK